MSIPESAARAASIAAGGMCRSRARRVIRALAEHMLEEAVEKAARVLCVEDGRYAPDDLDRLFVCDADSNPLPAWCWYENQARAAIAAFLKTVGEME